MNATTAKIVFVTTDLRQSGTKLKYVTTRQPSPPVLFPEKLTKIVATRGEIISLKFTKYGLDPLGLLKRSLRLPSHNKSDNF